MYGSDRACMRSLLEAEKKLLKRRYVLFPLLHVCRTNTSVHSQVAAVGTRWSKQKQGHPDHLRRRSARFIQPQTPMPSATWTRSMLTSRPPRRSESATRRSPVGPRMSSSMVSCSCPNSSLLAGQHGSHHAFRRPPARRTRGPSYLHGSPRSSVPSPARVNRSEKFYSNSDTSHRMYLSYLVPHNHIHTFYHVLHVESDRHRTTRVNRPCFVHEPFSVHS